MLIERARAIYTAQDNRAGLRRLDALADKFVQDVQDLVEQCGVKAGRLFSLIGGEGNRELKAILRRHGVAKVSELLSANTAEKALALLMQDDITDPDQSRHTPGGVPAVEPSEAEIKIGTVRQVRLAENEQGNVRQVILQMEGSPARAPKFGTLMLVPDRFPALNFQTWGADFFSLDEDEGPYLMIWADEKTAQFREASLLLAYAFCKFDAGGLVATFTGIDLPGDDTPWGGLVDSQLPLDSWLEDAVARFERSLKRDVIHMCFAGSSNDRGTYRSISDGSRIDFKPPRCEFDRVFSLPIEARALLNKEFTDLQSYHKSLRAAVRDPQRCMEQLDAAFPTNMHPVLGYRFVSA